MEKKDTAEKCISNLEDRAKELSYLATPSHQREEEEGRQWEREKS